MSAARRPLLTATAAGTLLGALWFVPSANATDDRPASGTGRAGSPAAPREPAGQDAQELRLAETGSPDTTPYLVGGTGLLTAGAGLVAFAMRRGAHTAR
ncbi:LAETG motif-containing sortase-dependent surface protein [Streptomyces sp. CC228A]|uniref:LAETG motif-containing sortase-dependent surface protein n=1 Tax=Streptomyces sp. CC228A TaxID=2898186 RepID=UPI001F15D844|nr:LAETG motif-containing sortase-dependent surface protein [Streptomyces sp. CC228A]